MWSLHGTEATAGLRGAGRGAALFPRGDARGTDQSALSRRIRELERDLGAKLFSRSTRGTRIAAAGEAFLPLARAILSKMEQAHQAIRQSAAGGKAQRLRIGMCEEVPLLKLSGLLAQLRARERGMEVQLIERSCTRLIQDVQTGALDITFRLARKEPVELADLPQESPLVIAGPGFIQY